MKPLSLLTELQSDFMVKLKALDNRIPTYEVIPQISCMHILIYTLTTNYENLQCFFFLLKMPYSYAFDLFCFVFVGFFLFGFFFFILKKYIQHHLDKAVFSQSLSPTQSKAAQHKL